jgi:hypothetical protein
MIKRERLEESSSPESSSPGSSASQLRVRGRPFQRGNPGRPPGSKNQINRLLEELGENEAENLIRKMIELAKAGNVRALQYCLDRLWPQRRSEPINLELPKIDRMQDIAPAMATVAHAATNGTIAPEQACQMVGVLESCGNALAAADFAVRLEKVESVLKLQGKM